MKRKTTYNNKYDKYKTLINNARAFIKSNYAILNTHYVVTFLSFHFLSEEPVFLCKFNLDKKNHKIKLKNWKETSSLKDVFIVKFGSKEFNKLQTTLYCLTSLRDLLNYNLQACESWLNAGDFFDSDLNFCAKNLNLALNELKNILPKLKT